jgi:hypothetical protein
LHSLFRGKFSRRDEDTLLKKAIILGQAEDRLLAGFVLFVEAEGLGGALVGHFGELDEVLGLFSHVEGELAILDIGELFLLFVGEVAVRLALGRGVISLLHIFYYDKQLTSSHPDDG